MSDQVDDPQYGMSVHRYRLFQLGSRRRAFLWGALATVLGFGSAGAQTSVGTPVSEVVIGAVIPMTGGNAASGAKMKSGYEMAVDEVNKQGGIKSLGGAKLKLIVRDSEGVPDIGARQAQALITTDKAAVIVGTYTSGVAATVARVTERLKVPFVITDAAADELTQSGFKYLFRADIKGEIIARDTLKAVDWANKKLGITKNSIMILSEGSAYGQSMKVAFERQAAQSGNAVADSIVFKAGTPDLSPQAARIKAADAEWLVGAWYTSDVIMMLNSFPGLGVNPVRAMAYGGDLQNPSTLKLGKAADGAVGMTTWNPDVKLPGAQEWGERFKARFDTDATANSAKAYRGIWIIADVLDRAGSLDSEKMRAAFSQTNITSGPATIVQKGPIKFDETGQLAATLVMIQVQNGNFATVWPEDVAAAKLDETRLKQGMVLK